MPIFTALARGNLVVFVSIGTLGLLCCQVQVGFMGFLFLPPPLLYQVHRLVRQWPSPEDRLHHAGAIAIILLTIITVAAAQSYFHNDARKCAYRIVNELNRVKSTTGSYPASLRDVTELSESKLRRYRFYFSNTGNTPFFVYPSTFVPFDTWQYDFPNGVWKYQPD